MSNIFPSPLLKSENTHICHRTQRNKKSFKNILALRSARRSKHSEADLDSRPDSVLAVLATFRAVLKDGRPTYGWGMSERFRRSSRMGLVTCVPQRHLASRSMGTNLRPVFPHTLFPPEPRFQQTAIKSISYLERSGDHCFFVLGSVHPWTLQASF